MVELKRFGFYTINSEYLEYLHGVDSEVYYNAKYKDRLKPFVGIVVGVGSCDYFIPLTSAKQKHRTWKNSSEGHFLIYDVVSVKGRVDSKVYKPYSIEECLHILAVLDIKKMIPVPSGYYEPIDFGAFSDEKYKGLFEKEYSFCLKIEDKIRDSVENAYLKQTSGGFKGFAYCDYVKLEQAMFKWLEDKGDESDS